MASSSAPIVTHPRNSTGNHERGINVAEVSISRAEIVHPGPSEVKGSGQARCKLESFDQFHARCNGDSGGPSLK